ncbi:DUF2085 domain-containing protein [Chloroflexia bacterium SDU3-3]|nr:DUF2085 domain-containing protein [Chloroflexia bacterium SDU3-3]
MTARALRAEWPLLLAMSVLFLGPLIAPLFQATGVWGLADSGALARDLLSRYVCPTPAKSYVLLGYPMAVCARCWGATVGLWAAWLLLRFAPGLRPYLGLPVPLRVLLGVLAFLLWPAEIVGWPAAPLWALLANGALAGLLGGLALLSVWGGQRRLTPA